MISFNDIFSQDAAVQVLQRAWRVGRMPHGLLFAGPTGVGKATTARALAALHLCQRPNDCQPCGTCPACLAMAGAAHPDYHIITKELVRHLKDSKASALSIDVIRTFLIGPASQKAMMGTGKFFLVEEADLMNADAQNALLKTLEEPYGQTIIVLLSEQPESLLPTIRSRCQAIRFGRLDRRMVEEQLRARQIAPEATAAAADLVDGSLGLALRWLEDGVVAKAAELAAEMDGVLQGRPPRDLPGWLKKACDESAERELARDPDSSKDVATRRAAGLYMMIAARRFRQNMERQTDPAILDQACRAIESLALAETYLDANVTTAVVFQQLAMALAAG